MSSWIVTRVLLPVSLAFNVFFAVVAVMHPGRDRPAMPPPPPFEMIGRMAEGLPSADAAILRETFAAEFVDRNGIDAAMRDMPGRIRAVLVAPKFDEQALRDVFADGRKARERMDDAFESAFITAVTRMSEAGRRKLSEWEPPHPPPHR